MNPLQWKHWHLVAWGGTTTLGAVIGLFLGWLRSPFSHGPYETLGSLFLVWLRYPNEYWPWAAFGAVIAALGFYSADLLTGSN